VPPLGPEEVFKAVTAVHQRLRGSYAVIAFIAGRGMLAFRDPHGIRPLCLGRGADGAVMVASESWPWKARASRWSATWRPARRSTSRSMAACMRAQCAPDARLSPCIFEYVYLARPDSVLDGISVYQARLRLGETLAKRVVSTVPPAEIDVVIPIPESSRPSANELARLLGKPYREGFVKNRYVGRTFIMPGQAVRKKSVRQKLNPIGSEFAGRNVLLVDDSIVRGTTSREIVQMARDAGARKVYMASAAPPVRFPNVYGIDMPTREELVAHGRTVEQVRQLIGADALIYQDVEAMKQAVAALNPAVHGFDASCFDGVYVTGDIGEADVDRLSRQRHGLASAAPAAVAA
jgi:amidophosphoribosyltransferase